MPGWFPSFSCMTSQERSPVSGPMFDLARMNTRRSNVFPSAGSLTATVTMRAMALKANDPVTRSTGSWPGGVFSEVRDRKQRVLEALCQVRKGLQAGRAVLRRSCGGGDDRVDEQESRAG